MVTHDLREAGLLADRLCILDGGATLQEGPPGTVMSRPRNARVSELVGLRDIYSGTFYRGVRWVIAGEHLHLSALPAPEANVVGCVVQRTRLLGQIMTIECRLQGSTEAVAVHLEVMTQYAGQLGLEMGKEIFLRLDPRGIHIMPTRSGAQRSFGAQEGTRTRVV